ncbi:MAG: response regulator transcription factor [Armatimonadetes bacterium]|nr:response regulator transcription factor [Armatimonadota bacterium]
MTRIYVFGDRSPLIDACRFALGRLGYVVYTPPDVLGFLEAVYAQAPNLVIIDLVADGMGGLKLCRELRRDARLAQMPILLVATPALLAGITPEAGFDDFLVEPFGAEEVETRVRLVQWRLHGVAGGDLVQVGPLKMDLAGYRAWLEGEAMDLTHLEFELLRFLATHRGVVYTRETLLSLVWGEDYYGGSRTVDVHIRRLRAKLGSRHEDLIQTVRGVGYRFEEIG